MKEIIALHEAILALELEPLFEEGVDFSRDTIGDGIELLPDELQARVEFLQGAINAALPEDFDYFAICAIPDEPASFSLDYDRMPAGGSIDGTFLPERSLIEQLREVDWEEQRAKGRGFREKMDDIIRFHNVMSGSLRSAKVLQREFREDTKEFIKEKRKDAARIHVMYQDVEERMMEAAFEHGEALREMLPSLIAAEAEVITIVAGGKPLPVERIDALMHEAQRSLRAEIVAKGAEAREAEAREAEPAEGERPREPDGSH